jgi:hypothetical protein
MHENKIFVFFLFFFVIVLNIQFSFLAFSCNVLVLSFSCRFLFIALYSSFLCYKRMERNFRPVTEEYSNVPNIFVNYRLFIIWWTVTLCLLEGSSSVAEKMFLQCHKWRPYICNTFSITVIFPQESITKLFSHHFT